MPTQSISKSLCETMAREMVHTDGLDIGGLRLSVVYGVGRRRGDMTCPSALMRDTARTDSIVVRFGDQKLPWQYVEEVASMTLAALDSRRRGGDCVANPRGHVGYGADCWGLTLQPWTGWLCRPRTG